MSVQHYYAECCKHKGKAVEIRTKDGRLHKGIIDRVDHDMVYIRPIQQGVGGPGGPGHGGAFLWGPWGFGYGAAYGLALGSIVGLTLLPFFFI